ncbi:MAG: hypothetical protein K6G31_05880 [Paludibacteraceae bacterium]|nr:hypothetical protein [Paludibacteraceae bacterium]
MISHLHESLLKVEFVANIFKKSLNQVARPSCSIRVVKEISALIVNPIVSQTTPNVVDSITNRRIQDKINITVAL